MYTLRVALVVFVAFAAVPALSAPLRVTSRRSPHSPESPIPARDPGPALSRGEIRDLLNSLNLRSEDVIAALSGRDDGADTPSRSPNLDTIARSLGRREADHLDHAISARDESEPPLGPLRRDGLPDDAHDIFSGGSIASEVGAIIGRLVGARALLDAVERDGLLDTQDRRSFFGSIGHSIDNTVSDFGEAANDVINSGGTTTSGTFFRRIVEARALLDAVERDGLLDTQDRRDFVSDVVKNVTNGTKHLGNAVPKTIPRGTVEARAPLDAVERDGLFDTQDRRGFFSDLGHALGDAVGDVGDAATDFGNAVVNSASETVSRRTVEARAPLDAVERDGLLDTQDRRGFFSDLGHALGDAVGDVGDAATDFGNAVVNSASETVSRRTVEARALLDAVERDGLLGDLQDLRRDLFSNLENNIESAVGLLGDAGSPSRRVDDRSALLDAVERDGLLSDLLSNLENNVASSVGSRGDVGSPSRRVDDRSALLDSLRGDGMKPDAKSKAYVIPKVDTKLKADK